MLNSLAISKPFQWIVIFLAVISVAVADVMLKKAAAHSNSNLMSALSSPWFLGAVGLYLFQIGFFIFAFIAGWKLSVVGALQTALYALIILGAGVFLYNESLTRIQMTGVLLSVTGVLMINWPQ